MRFRLVLSLVFLTVCAVSMVAQTELTIKKKTSIKVPGMESMPKLPNGMTNPLENRSSMVYIKGARMRSDTQMQVPKIGMFGSGMKTVTFTNIMQCDKQRNITFNSDKKKYYQDSFGGVSAQDAQKLKKGGYVTMTGSVTDTGNRAKLFGYEAKHLKQTFIITPSKNACLKEILHIETEGWYADLPEFTCPMKRKVQDFQMDNKCYDEVIDEVKGAITGFALKEVKKITSGGQTITLEEEATSLNKTTLADSLFDPPTGYTAANTLREIQEDTGAESNAQSEVPTTQVTPPTDISAPSFPLPAAGVETATVGEKKAGTIRIGVVMPKVTTPESKNDSSAGDDVAIATRNYLVESLKAENVEAIALETDSEDEARNRNCDYIFYANVTQKRGGGMFKSMVLMGAATMAGAMVPGVGGMIATTVATQVMGQTMGKMAKAKDEFTLDYKVVGLDKTVISKAVTKAKTKEDGEDVLTPQIKQASTAVLGEIAKKQPK